MSVEVVEPVVAVKRRVVVAPGEAASVLVGSRARHHGNLAIAARGFRIHRRHDNFDFFNHVGTGVDGGPCAVFITAVIDVDTVARRIDVAETSAGHVSEGARRIALDARRCSAPD